MEQGCLCLRYMTELSIGAFSSSLADHTNGRAIATLLRLSSSVVVCLSVCNVMYCG